MFIEYLLFEHGNTESGGRFQRNTKDSPRLEISLSQHIFSTCSSQSRNCAREKEYSMNFKKTEVYILGAHGIAREKDTC